MNEQNPDKSEIAKKILSRYHLDKLCPRCNGPLEKHNVNRCDECDRLLNLKAQIQTIENSCLRIKHVFKLKNQPSPVRLPTTKKRQTKTRKKPTKKTTKKARKK